MSTRNSNTTTSRNTRSRSSYSGKLIGYESEARRMRNRNGWSYNRIASEISARSGNEITERAVKYFFYRH